MFSNNGNLFDYIKIICDEMINMTRIFILIHFDVDINRYTIQLPQIKPLLKQYSPLRLVATAIPININYSVEPVRDEIDVVSETDDYLFMNDNISISNSSDKEDRIIELEKELALLKEQIATIISSNFNGTNTTKTNTVDIINSNPIIPPPPPPLPSKTLQQKVVTTPRGVLPQNDTSTINNVAKEPVKQSSIPLLLPNFHNDIKNIKLRSVQPNCTKNNLELGSNTTPCGCRKCNKRVSIMPSNRKSSFISHGKNVRRRSEAPFFIHSPCKRNNVGFHKQCTLEQSLHDSTIHHPDKSTTNVQNLNNSQETFEINTPFLQENNVDENVEFEINDSASPMRLIAQALAKKFAKSGIVENEGYPASSVLDKSFTFDRDIEQNDKYAADSFGYNNTAVY